MPDDDDNPFETTVDAREVEPIVQQIRPLLAGKPPELQGAVLADLVSIFVTGHHPLIRDQVMRDLFNIARELIEPNEHLLFPDGKKPEGWEPS